MGDVNQYRFVQKHAGRLAGPYLEIGSNSYGAPLAMRELFAKRDRYVGIDLAEGPGVDRVLDLAVSFEEVDAKLDGVRFGTVFCMSVLEHCAQPFRMAENITRLLKPEGQVCVSVPFAWKVHAFPSDYWRFTPEGVKLLFPRLSFDPADGSAASSRVGEFRPLDERLGRVSLGFSPHWKEGHPLRGISATFLKSVVSLGLWRWALGYRYLLTPTSVLMIGTLNEPQKSV
jgi:SAM-dependent methyltransferase